MTTAAACLESSGLPVFLPKDPMALSARDLIDPVLDGSHKGFPAQVPPLRRSEVGSQGWNVLAGDLPLPLAVIRREALSHNLGWMRGFVEARQLALAPHGKTSMSPQLFQSQLAAGAWGMTFASVAQARVGAAAGARRILIANQVLQAADLRALSDLRAQYAGLRVIFLLDSLAQLALIEAAPPQPPFEVLLELGLSGGRTGCRTHDQALALARRAPARRCSWSASSVMRAWSPPARTPRTARRSMP